MKKKISKIMGVGLSLVLMASLLVMAVPVFAATSIGAVDAIVSVKTISTPANYTITFTVDQPVPEDVGFIEVQFPVGTTVPATVAWVDGDITVQSTAGFGVANPAEDILKANMTTTAGTATVGPKVKILLDDLTNDIGEAATVRVKFVNLVVTNAPNLGDQTLKVNTSADTTQVTSNTFALIAPVIPAVPGVVKGYNAAGVKIYEETGGAAIQGALDKVGIDKVVIGPGTYDEDVDTDKVEATVKTIESSDGALVTIIKDADTSGAGGTLKVDTDTTVTGLTVVGRTFGIWVTVDGATIQDCVLSGAGGDALDIDAGIAATKVASIGNTISVATGKTGLTLADGKVATSTGDTFTVTGTGKAIINDGILTMSGATISGGSGIGYESTANAGASTISGSTFSGLDTGILVTDMAANLTVSGNTLTGCGKAAANPAINVVAITGGLLSIVDNTITDCVDEILQVVAGAVGAVFMNFNAINNPAKGIDGKAATVDCANNLWDGGVAPPVTSTNAKTTPYLTKALSNAKIAPGGAGALTAKTTAGVNVAVTAGAETNIGVGNYAANPGTAAVPGNVIRYFDVYVAGAPTAVTLTFFGITTAAANLYAWSASQGVWVNVGAAVDLFQGALITNITAVSTPNLANLAGLPFAMTEPALAPLDAIGGDTLVPEIAAQGVEITPTFTWGAVAGADKYDFEIAEYIETAVTADNPFTIKLYGDTARINAHVARYALKYDTQYNWRVRPSRVIGMQEVGTGANLYYEDIVEKGAWTEGLFITEAEPVEAEPPIIIEEPTVQPAPIINIEPIVIPPAEADPVQVIPPVLLWVIVAVGAILVIAVIVLIVRTRRVT